MLQLAMGGRISRETITQVLKEKHRTNWDRGVLRMARMFHSGDYAEAYEMVELQERGKKKHKHKKHSGHGK